MKNKRKKILVFGYFGYVTNQLDGQTVKTREIYKLLNNNAKAEVKFADTQAFRVDKRNIWVFFKNILTCDQLIILPCLNNLKYLFPPLFILSKIFRFEIIHVGIGGWHREYLAKWPIVRYMLKRIKINLLENTLTCKELEDDFGFKNIGVIPNFRDDVPPAPIKRTHSDLRLVFLARINIKKGLDTLVKLSEKIENSVVKNNVKLDFYGPFDSDSDKNFLYENLVNKYDFINYGGRLNPENILEKLSDYDVMLFPTHYYTEGFPGSILDAYRAGIPVIATEWKHSHQFIENDVNGYIVDFDNPETEIYDKITLLLDDKSKLRDLQKAAYKESFKYLPSEGWNVLSPYVENDA